MHNRRDWQALWSRIRACDSDELFDRARQEISKRVDYARYRVGRPWLSTVAGENANERGHFFFNVEQVPSLIQILRERFPETAAQIVGRAERICDHHFDLLGYTDLDYGSEIDWHCDSVHNKRAPREAWFRIAYLDFDEVGDVKVTWELNRHQHLVTLAKACRITGEERFAIEALAQWHHWCSQNPYPVGVNWSSSLEVGIRSISWLWMWFLLHGCSVVPASFETELLPQLAVSARHIERYLSTYFSPNTHLLGEAVALFFIGTLCPGLKHARRWQRRGWEIVLQAANRQVGADGMHFERSTYYHVYALDFFMHAGLLAARNDIPVPASFDHTIEKMAEALALVSQAGLPACFGDDDGGRVFDPHRNRTGHLVDPLATAAVVCARPDFKSIAGEPCEEMLWLLGSGGLRQFDELPVGSFATRSAALAQSGLYTMTASGVVPKQQIVINSGRKSPGSEGHEHADLLSLQIIARGHALLIDPGTCEYVGSARDAFRSTGAHNTLTIDGMDQSEGRGPFAWGDRARGKVDRWICGANFDLFVGSHDGYRRLPDSPIHSRFVFHRKSRFLLVRDVVAGEGRHYLKLSWRIAPDLERHARSYPLFMTADRTLGLGLIWPTNHGWAQAAAREAYAPVYGQREMTTALHLEREAKLPAELATLLLPVADANADPGTLKRLDKSAQAGVTVYAYAAADEEYRCFFAAAKPWQFDGWASDAEFISVYSRCGCVEEIVICNGSFLDWRGQRVLFAKSEIEFCELRKAGASADILAGGESVEVLGWPTDAESKSLPETPSATEAYQ